MDFKDMAIKLAMQKLGVGGDEGTIGAALSALTGSGTESDGFDIAELASKFSGGGLGDAVQSWLGDGANESVSAEQVTNSLGADKIAGFAAKLGLSEGDAASKLSGLLPDLLDQSSSGGNLLEGAASLASKFFK